jgi:hypothetical protein
MKKLCTECHGTGGFLVSFSHLSFDKKQQTCRDLKYMNALLKYTRSKAKKLKTVTLNDYTGFGTYTLEKCKLDPLSLLEHHEHSKYRVVLNNEKSQHPISLYIPVSLKEAKRWIEFSSERTITKHVVAVSDGTIEYVRKRHPHVRKICTPSNTRVEPAYDHWRYECCTECNGTGKQVKLTGLLGAWLNCECSDKRPRLQVDNNGRWIS